MIGRRHLLAALLMLLAWPASEYLNTAHELGLRRAGAALAWGILRCAGVGVTREGTVLQTASGRFDVLLPCSGGKFLGMTLALGLASIALGSARPPRRVLTLALLVPLALAGNALRVAGLVLCGAGYGDGIHRALGICCFAIVAAAVVWLARVGRPAEA